MEMSKEKRREVKDLKGNPIRDYPETRLITRPRRGPGGIIIGETVEVENEPMEVITGARAPPKQIEEQVKTTPTRAKLQGHRAVDARDWGLFRQPGPKTVALKPVPPKQTGRVGSVITPKQRRDDSRLKRFLDSLTGKEKQ